MSFLNLKGEVNIKVSYFNSTILVVHNPLLHASDKAPCDVFRGYSPSVL